jgi:hypothetical protein
MVFYRNTKPTVFSYQGVRLPVSKPRRTHKGDVGRVISLTREITSNKKVREYENIFR